MARTGMGRMVPAHEKWPVWRLLGVCAVALTTANCAGNTQKFASSSSGGEIDPKYGVRASKRLYSEGDAIPKGGGRRFSGKPYVVAGRTYVPREDARGYVREGLASWYGSAFHGRMTANGEVFDRHSIAAAHPTLPLPSYARVTNLANGYSMVVRVNDRGPYHANRVMDVSEETARALDFHRKGTERVRVEYIGRASVSGSDDRKLLATLRTDGRPAPTGAPVMVADLGGGEPEPERFARSAKPALAFKPEGKDEDAAEPKALPVRRPAPVLVASVAHVAVPPAVQPTATRAAPFKPAPVATASPSPTSGRAARNAPLSLAPPALRLSSGADRLRAPAHTAGPAKAIASKSPAMSSDAKLAMARLAAAATPAKAKATASDGKPAGSRRSRMAAVAD